MLNSITKIAARNTLFASLCQDILVDMLTDDIQSVRLLAITALQVVGDQVSSNSWQNLSTPSLRSPGTYTFGPDHNSYFSTC